tara:strand:- start:4525 stop:5232 length:708 start_codon:yes stop_codon:yes gene_type:complete
MQEKIRMIEDNDQPRSDEPTKAKGEFAAHAPYGVLSREQIQRGQNLTRKALRVLMGLSTYMRGPGKWFKLRIRTLATMLGYAYETVRAALRELRTANLVQSKATFYDRDGAAAQGANSYRLVFAEAEAPEPKARVKREKPKGRLEILVHAAIEAYGPAKDEANRVGYEEELGNWTHYKGDDSWKPEKPDPVDAWQEAHDQLDDVIWYIVEHVRKQFRLNPPSQRAIGRALERVLA